MNRPIRDAHFLSFTRGLMPPAPVNIAPLEALEAKALASQWRCAELGSLFVLARRDGDFSYQWGDAEISRTEAAFRAVGRAS